MRDVAELPVRGDADIAAVASLLADPARCKVLLALDDGRALPASVLADEAGISRPTASSHLGKLTDAGLLSVETHGRHRYYRLAGPEVGDLLEHLVRLAPSRPVRSLREGTRAARLRSARTCYDHLAGRLGVEIMGSLLERKVLVGGDGRYRPAPRRPRCAEQPRPRDQLRAHRRRPRLPPRHRSRVADGQKATGAVLRRLDRAAPPLVRCAGAGGARSHAVGRVDQTAATRPCGDSDSERSHGVGRGIRHRLAGLITVRRPKPHALRSRAFGPWPGNGFDCRGIRARRGELRRSTYSTEAT